MVKIANLTPHPISLLREGGEVVEVKPLGFTLRVGERIKRVGEIDGFTIIKKELEEISNEDLEQLKQIAQEFDIIITSFIAAQKLMEYFRKGVLEEEVVKKVFIIGETVRDSNGRVVAAKSLATLL